MTICLFAAIRPDQRAWQAVLDLRHNQIGLRIRGAGIGNRWQQTFSAALVSSVRAKRAIEPDPETIPRTDIALKRYECGSKPMEADSASQQKIAMPNAPSTAALCQRISAQEIRATGWKLYPTHALSSLKLRFRIGLVPSESINRLLAATSISLVLVIEFSRPCSFQLSRVTSEGRW